MDWRILEEAELDETRGFTVMPISSLPDLSPVLTAPVIATGIRDSRDWAIFQREFLSCYDGTSEVLLWNLSRGAGKRLPLDAPALPEGKGEWYALLDPDRAILRKASSFTMRPLLDVMKSLREEGGCPWDRAQTAETLRTYLIQEAYEVVDAIEKKDRQNWKEELGDVLFQVVFQARIAEEAGLFTMQDVVDGITEKMIRRHPYVFGSLTAEETASLLGSWEERKIREKKRKHLLSGLSRSLPSLLFACIMQKKVSSICRQPPMLWKDIRSRLAKSLSRMEESAGAHRSDRQAELLTGEMLFQAVRLSVLIGVDPELALGRFNDCFAARFCRLEDSCRKEGREPDEISPEALMAVEKEILDEDQ